MLKNTKNLLAIVGMVVLFGSIFEPAVFAKALVEDVDTDPTVVTQFVQVAEVKNESVVQVNSQNTSVSCYDAAVKANEIQGSVLDLNLPASCYTLTASSAKMFSGSLKVVNLKTQGIVKVVSVPAKLKSPTLEKTSTQSLPLLPANTFEIFITLVSFSFLLKLVSSSVYKLSISSNLNISFNRFSVLRC